jgi:tetratricopeptide (TPR) repeat protein
LFASAEQKAALMGAGHTYIAKPWRHEIYLNAGPFPHPVVRHELAHVIAGSFGTGPFRVAGPLGGIIPDPGRIEGFAVAAAPREDTDLSLYEWARAMRDLELLPKVSSLFRLSFLGTASTTAYTAAGAFVSFLHQELGPGPLKRWYEGESADSALGKSLDEWEQAFIAHLDQVTVSEAAMAEARARFDRPAIFGRRCPHAVDALGAEAGGALRRQDPVLALSLYRDVLALDPHDLDARLGLGSCAELSGEPKSAEERYQVLVDDPTLTEHARGVARERLGDLALATRQYDTALVHYEKARQSAVNEHRLRGIDAKEYAAKRGLNEPDGLATRAITELLIGDLELGTEPLLASAWLGEWTKAEPENGLAGYLLGKNLYNRGRYEEALAELESALSQKLEPPSAEREALRVKVILACVLGRKDVGASAAKRFAELEDASPARREGVARLADRCGFLQ